MTIPDFSVKRPIATKMIFLLLIIVGMYSLRHLPVNLLPDLNYPHLRVVTEYPNVGPREVDNFVTKKIISQVNGLENISSIRGSSKDGVSVVSIKYNWGTDMDYALLFLRQALDQVAWSLPHEASRPTILKEDPSQKPIMGYALLSENLPALSELARNVFAKRFEELDGVAKVDILGEYRRNIRVNIDPIKLMHYGLSYDEVAEAIRWNNLTFMGGTIARGDKKYSLNISGNLVNIESLKKVAVMKGKHPIPLEQLAAVVYDYEESYNKSLLNQNETIGLMIYKESAKNILKTAKKLDAAVAELRQEYPGVQFVGIMNEAAFVRSSVNNLLQSLGLGSILAFFVLLVFIRKFWKTLVIFINIPVSIVIIIMVMYFLKVDINVISLAGLALGCGMLVDNSIIVFENIHRHESGKLDKQTVAAGTNQVARAITASTFTNICVFFPLIYLSGITGELLKDLALTATASLAVSLISALSLMPSLLVTRVPLLSFLRRYRRAKPFKTKRLALRVYESILEFFLKRRVILLPVLIIVFMVVLFSAGHLKKEIFPETSTDLYEVHVQMEENTPFDKTVENVRSLVALLNDSISGFVFSNIGMSRTGSAFGSESVNSAVLTLRCDRETDAEKEIHDIIDKADIGLIHAEIKQKKNVLERLGEELDYEYIVKIKGNNWDNVETAYRSMVAGLANAGYDVSDWKLAGSSLTYRLRVRQEMLEKYEIARGALLKFIQTQLQGLEVSTLNLVNESFEIVLTPRKSRDLLVNKFLHLNYQKGKLLIPLGRLVHLEEMSTVSEITSENGEPTIEIPLKPGANDSRNIEKEFRNFVKRMNLPDGVQITVESSLVKVKGFLLPLIAVFLLSLVLIYSVLAIQYESLTLPLIILVSIPFALTGTILLMHITGTSLNIIALVGMVVLIGVAVNDAILKVDFYEKWRKKGENLISAVKEVGKIRLRPIVMTSFTTIFALLPILLLPEGNTDLWKPLAVVIIGGLFSSTFLTLFVLPVVYITFINKTTNKIEHE